MLQEVQCIVYIVRAFDLAPQDDNGLADPYIKIKYGREKISDRKNYIANTLEPTFGRFAELFCITLLFQACSFHFAQIQIKTFYKLE